MQTTRTDVLDFLRTLPRSATVHTLIIDHVHDTSRSNDLTVDWTADVIAGDAEEESQGDYYYTYDITRRIAGGTMHAIVTHRHTVDAGDGPDTPLRELLYGWNHPADCECHCSA